MIPSMAFFVNFTLFFYLLGTKRMYNVYPKVNFCLLTAVGGEAMGRWGVTYATNDASMKPHQVFELLLHYD